MTKTCPNCGSQNRDVARFCQNCQTPLDFNCPNCGTVNTGKARFCLHCGAALHTPSNPLQGATQQPAGSQIPTGAPWPTQPPGSVLAVGMVLDAGHYRIDQVLGGGGMGKVYKAYDLRLAKYWAIKEMTDTALTDPNERALAIQNFKNEAQMLANLDHHNLPKVTNHFQENGKYYLVMDFIDGETLEAMLDRRIVNNSGPFPEAQVLKWAEDLCDVLGYLHRQNPPIIFRDLKPGNIMVEKNGRLRLIDFGVARLFKAGKSRDTASFGTQGFAPPEQYGKGQTDARSDVYALGATLHFLLTLRDPSNEPLKFPDISTLNRSASRPVCDAIATAVKFERDDRWPTMADFAQALKGKPAARQAPPVVSINQQVPAAAAASSVPAATPVYKPPVAPPPVTPPASTPPAGAVQTGATPANKVRRSGFWGFLLWVAICSAGLFFLQNSLEGLLWSSDPFSNGMAFGALFSFPMMLSLLRTRWPAAFSLPMMVTIFLETGDTEVVQFAFIGMLAGEIIFLFQSFNPKTFWRLFFGSTIALWVMFFFINEGSVNEGGYFLGLAVGTGAAAMVGRILSGAFHWDS